MMRIVEISMELEKEPIILEDREPKEVSPNLYWTTSMADFSPI